MMKVGDEVLVVQHKNQVELAGTIITTRSHRPFKSVIVGTVAGFEHKEGTGFAEMGHDIFCTVTLGSRQIKVKGDSENGWFDPIFLLPQNGE
jgi:hypothetical protein